MKHTLLVLITIILTITCGKAQNSKFFEQGPRNWNLTEQVQDKYLLLGNQASASGLILAVTDSTGKILSEKSYPGYIYQDATVLHDKGIAVTGNMKKASSDSVFLMRFDSTGTLLWAKYYYSLASTGIQGMYVSPSQNNGYWLVGQLATAGNSRQFIIKTNETGGLLYSKGVRYDSNGGTSYNFGKMIEGTDNSCYFTFGYELGTEPPLIGLLRTDSILNFKWCMNLGVDWTSGSLPSNASNYIAFYNHHVYVSWYTPQLMSPEDTFYQSANLSMFDSTGLSEKRFEWKVSFYGWGNSIYIGKKGNIFMGGQCMPVSNPNSTAFILSLDSSWNQSWSKLYYLLSSSSSYSYIQYLAPTKDNGIISAGNYFIKTDSTGNSACNNSAVNYSGTIITNTTQPMSAQLFNTPFNSFSIVPVPNTITDTIHTYCYVYTGVDEISDNNNSAVSLYPNPNHGSFTLEVNTGDTKSQLTIYNILGEEIYRSNITREINHVNIGTQPDGIYFYRITHNTGALSGSGKIIISQ
jgi:hypothetical protein